MSAACDDVISTCVRAKHLHQREACLDTLSGTCARTSKGRSQRGSPESAKTDCSFEMICTAISSCRQSSPLLTITGRSAQRGDRPCGESCRRRATFAAHFSPGGPAQHCISTSAHAKACAPHAQRACGLHRTAQRRGAGRWPAAGCGRGLRAGQRRSHVLQPNVCTRADRALALMRVAAHAELGAPEGMRWCAWRGGARGNSATSEGKSCARTNASPSAGWMTVKYSRTYSASHAICVRAEAQ